MKSVLIIMLFLLIGSTAWALIANTEQFLRVSPDDQVPAFQATKCSVRYEDATLVFQWVMEIDSTFCPGTFTADDRWAASDYARVQIITSPSDYYAYFFYAFPAGSYYDGIRNSDLSSSTEWDSQYTYESTISDSTWNCTMRIPCKDLRYSGSPPYQWQIILTRYYQTLKEAYSFPYAPISMEKDYFKSGASIVIDEKLPSQMNWQVLPYAVDKYDLMREENDLDENSFGIDFCFHPKPNMTLNATVNPDYSDIPPDSEQDIFNLEYNPYYEENRYFFVSDLSIFDIDTSVYYSRTILQPVAALKYINSSASYNYGILVAQDDDDIEDSVGKVFLASFLSKYKSVNLHSSIIANMQDDEDNEVLQFKPTWYISPTKWLTIDGYLSRYQHDDNDVLLDLYSEASYYQRAGDFSLSLDGYYIGRDFVSSLGRIYETNYSGYDAELSYEKESKGIIETTSTSVWVNATYYNNTNSLRTSNYGGKFGIEHSQHYSHNIFYTNSQEDYLDELYSQYTAYYNLNYTFRVNDRIAMTGSSGKELVYRLAQVKPWASINVASSIHLWSDFSLSASWTRKKYYDISEDETQSIDPSYDVANSDVTYYLFSTLFFTSGLRYHNYSIGRYKGHYGVYFNASWQVYNQVTVYAGYNSGADRYDDTWELDHKTLYLKIRAVLAI